MKHRVVWPENKAFRQTLGRWDTFEFEATYILKYLLTVLMLDLLHGRKVQTLP